MSEVIHQLANTSVFTALQNKINVLNDRYVVSFEDMYREMGLL